MGFNEEKDEIDHKTFQTGTDLVKWHGSGIGCVVLGLEEKVSMENILISQQSPILSIYQAGELVSSEKPYTLRAS